MANKKPRIAFCFSGQVRTLDQTYLFFQKNLFDAAKEQGFDYDVFCAVEDDENVDKVNLLNPTKVEKIKSSDVEKIIEKKWGKNWIESTFGNYAFPYPYSKSNYYHNLLQQFYKVSHSIALMVNSGNKYNIVVKLRFDIILFNKINFVEIDKNISEKGCVICNKAKHFVKRKIMQKKLLIINDFFFFGSHETMSLLGNIFDNFKTGLVGQEYKLNLIRRVFLIVRNMIFAVNYKLFHHWVLPLQPLDYIENLFYRVWSAEALYYFYFVNNLTSMELEDFSRILLRESSSIVNVVNKCRYER